MMRKLKYRDVKSLAQEVLKLVGGKPGFASRYSGFRL
jgi:hypothetical protein